MRYKSNSNTEILTEMVLTGKTKVEIKKEDLNRANTSKIYLSNDKVDDLARKWGETFSRGTK